VPAGEQIRRVVPVIQKLRKTHNRTYQHRHTRCRRRRGGSRIRGIDAQRHFRP
jgi:hypothetical protein